MNTTWGVILSVVVVAAIAAGFVLMYRRIRRRRLSVDLSALQVQYAPGAIEINRQAAVDASLPAPRAVPTEFRRP